MFSEYKCQFEDNHLHCVECWEEWENTGRHGTIDPKAFVVYKGQSLCPEHYWNKIRGE